MDRIRKLFHTFSKTEVRYLKIQLGAFHNRGSNKALELIEHLERHPEIGNHEMAELLYGEPGSKAFIMLKSRLFERMTETLSLSINFQNNPEIKEDPAAYASISLHKDLIYAMLLLRRGLEDMARELLTDCVDRATAYDLPEFRLQALLFLQGLSQSRDEVTFKYRAEIDQTQAQYQTDIQGLGIWNEFRIMQSHKTSGDDQREVFIREKMTLLEQRLAAHYSPRTHYYYLYIRVNYHALRSEWEAGREALREMIELLKTRKGLAQRNRLGLPWCQLAELELRTCRFRDAIHAADQALSILPRRRNYYNTSIYKTFAAIYSGDLDLARGIIQGLHWFTSQKEHARDASLTAYLDACICYLREDYRTAWNTLEGAQGLLDDKEGWNAGIRIFEMIILFDLGQYDLIITRIESMRKHLSRYKANLRTELILRFWHLLERQAFDLGRLPEEVNTLLQRLAAEDPWVPLGHEVVRFEAWLEARRTRQPLYPLLQRQAGQS
ncbi:MAG: hypothetical protein SF053_02980 [Bacteroidia bacterium]|nr:hypothetical protein [Bacteroidia bacterium]